MEVLVGQFRIDEGTRAVDVSGEEENHVRGQLLRARRGIPKITPINPEKNIGELHWLFLSHFILVNHSV